MLAVRLWMVLLCLLATPQVVGAQAAADPAVEAVSDQDRAVEMFQISERMYAEGQYGQALHYLQQAHALHPSPTLLYNMARAHEKLDQLPEAIEAYESFLGTVTEPRDREQAQLRIRTLKAELAERDALRQRRASEAATESEPEEAPPGWAANKTWTTDEVADGDAAESEPPPILPWVLVGSGGALTAIGAILFVVAKGKGADAKAESEQKAAYDLQSEGENLMLAGNILVVAGGVAAAVGAALLLADADPDKGTEASERGVRPVLGAGYMGLAGAF